MRLRGKAGAGGAATQSSSNTASGTAAPKAENKKLRVAETAAQTSKTGASNAASQAASRIRKRDSSVHNLEISRVLEDSQIESALDDLDNDRNDWLDDQLFVGFDDDEAENLSKPSPEVQSSKRPKTTIAANDSQVQGQSVVTAKVPLAATESSSQRRPDAVRDAANSVSALHSGTFDHGPQGPRGVPQSQREAAGSGSFQEKTTWQNQNRPRQDYWTQVQQQRMMEQSQQQQWLGYPHNFNNRIVKPIPATTFYGHSQQSQSYERPQASLGHGFDYLQSADYDNLLMDNGGPLTNFIPRLHPNHSSGGMEVPSPAASPASSMSSISDAFALERNSGSSLSMDDVAEKLSSQAEMINQLREELANTKQAAAAQVPVQPPPDEEEEATEVLFTYKFEGTEKNFMVTPSFKAKFLFLKSHRSQIRTLLLHLHDLDTVSRFSFEDEKAIDQESLPEATAAILKGFFVDKYPALATTGYQQLLEQMVEPQIHTLVVKIVKYYRSKMRPKKQPAVSTPARRPAAATPSHQNNNQDGNGNQ